MPNYVCKNFINKEYDNTTFSGEILIEKCNFINCTFTGCDLSQVKLDHSNMSDCIFNSCTFKSGDKSFTADYSNIVDSKYVGEDPTSSINSSYSNIEFSVLTAATEASETSEIEE